MSNSTQNTPTNTPSRSSSQCYRIDGLDVSNLVNELHRDRLGSSFDEGVIQIHCPPTATGDDGGAGQSNSFVTFSDADWGSLPSHLNLTDTRPPGLVNNIPSSVDDQGCFDGQRRLAPFIATSYPPAFRPGDLSWLSRSSAFYSLRLYLMGRERFGEWHETRRKKLDLVSNRRLEGDTFSSEPLFWFLDTDQRNDRILESLNRLHGDVQDGAIPCLYAAQMLVAVTDDGRTVEQPNPVRRVPFKMRFQPARRSVRKAFALAPEIGAPDPREGLAATLRQALCLAPFAE